VPVVIAFARSAGIDPTLPVVAAIMGASLGFLPVSTRATPWCKAPGACCRVMMRHGILDVVGVVTIVAIVWGWARSSSDAEPACGGPPGIEGHGVAHPRHRARPRGGTLSRSSAHAHLLHRRRLTEERRLRLGLIQLRAGRSMVIWCRPAGTYEVNVDHVCS
jgi:hypothetical protein